MNLLDRMARAYSDNVNISRKALRELTGAGESQAKRFLAQQRGVQKRKPTIKGGYHTIVSLHDWHVPYHDEKAVMCQLQFCKSIQPDEIILHELHDFYALSRFNKNPSRACQLQDEIDEVFTLLQRLREYCPNAKIRILKANHTDRLLRYLWSNATALYGIRALELPMLFRLAELDISYQPNYCYKGTLFKHGHVVRQQSAYTANAEYMREGTSGMSGHSHRGGCFYRTVRGGSYCWIEGGCACDLSPEYIQDDVANWQHGLGVATFENAGSQYHLQFVPIIKGKLLWGPHLVTWEG